MRYCLIANDRVANIVEAEEGYVPPPGFLLGPDGGEIGDYIVDGEYVRPNDMPLEASALYTKLANLRWQREVAGVVYGDVTLPTDRERRAALKQAADTLREGKLVAPIAVSLGPGIFASVTLEQIEAMIQAIADHVQAAFAAEAVVGAAIANGTVETVNELQAAWEAET